MKQYSVIFQYLGIICCIIVINTKQKLNKQADIFDYGCPCGERDVTEEEVN